MSDYLAVGGVSAVLKALLTTALSDGGPSTVLLTPPGVTNLAPDLIATGQDEPAQLNLFMYYASINPALRNLDLPSMGTNGQQLSNPPLAINLHYLITAYGANPFDPEILLGFAMRVFHNTPVVPRSMIQTALTALDSGTPSNEQQLVSGSTLASQIEHIRITPEALTTEEIYRLWTAFQVSYRPTTSYQVSVVVIQDTESFQSNLPVKRRSLVALPLTGPMIASVTPQMAAVGQLMTINGSNFLQRPGLEHSGLVQWRRADCSGNGAGQLPARECAEFAFGRRGQRQRDHERDLSFFEHAASVLCVQPVSISVDPHHSAAGFPAVSSHAGFTVDRDGEPARGRYADRGGLHRGPGDSAAAAAHHRTSDFDNGDCHRAHQHRGGQPIRCAWKWTARRASSRWTRIPEARRMDSGCRRWR